MLKDVYWTILNHNESQMDKMAIFPVGTDQLFHLDIQSSYTNTNFKKKKWQWFDSIKLFSVLSAINLTKSCKTLKKFN